METHPDPTKVLSDERNAGRRRHMKALLVLNCLTKKVFSNTVSNLK